MQDINKRDFLPYFDGLRGLAALVVFFGHAACSVYPALTSGQPDYSGLSFLPHLARTPFSLATAANSAVCIFFILSGYVMSMVAERSHESFMAITIRRYLRLAGPAAASCIFSAWLLKHHFYFNQSVAHVTGSTWLKQWFLFNGHYSVALKEGLFGIFQIPNSTYNSSLWTMYIELWGSIGIFSLFYLVKNKNLRFLSFILACGIAALLFDRRYEFFCIFAGAVSFNLHKYFHVNRLRENINTFFVFVGIFLCSYPDFAPSKHGGIIYNWISTHYGAVWYHAFGGILIIHFLHGSTIFKNFFSSPILLWLGKISFSFYLVHLAVICSLGSFLIAVFQSVLTYNQMAIIVILASGLMSLAVAQQFEKTVDTAFIRVGRWISKKIDLYFPSSATVTHMTSSIPILTNK